MAYTTIDDPEAYFQVKLYTGNGGSQSITFDGDTAMQADMIYIKERDVAHSSSIIDSVRGVRKTLTSDENAAVITESNGLSAFDSDGLTFDGAGGNHVNDSSQATVAWCWKESATSGFDIATFTGNGAAQNISHSLSAAPKMVITKSRSTTGAWYTYHAGVASDAETDYMVLDTTAAAGDASTVWNDTAPTSSVFTVGSGFDDGTTYVAYCFAPIGGYSKFSSYIGNGNASGPMIVTGFRPAYVLIKRKDSTGDWYIFDNKLIPRNTITQYLTANKNEAVKNAVAAYYIDFTSSGFKLRGTGSETNASGGTYIYAAFAEAPFVNSNGVPCNAR